ncbi:penicillin-binding protein 1A [Oceanihabitans sediminis]|uniref:Penicillin-binding protein n=2 Tax=Pseudomonadati TaxID=3379134 RepID=A0A368P6X0_9FLAO|nr:transglycosylase domain-containing protein [Oceanihabitans sediminis]MDX1279111.1 transglycosylase domain-containing protein [Oceanihabitans sediminis]MDX1772928.1 transglycosylase domain-containing protein [Oceanihabitans sediminis]RBP34620.1 penicillin-binding protein 1A [Oceanihabitans sediminis]RCU58278.1 penicillin-binding protein [Oceanihabitans sediminis]
MAKKQEKTQDFSKYIRLFWILFLGGFMVVIFLFLLASWGVFGPLPDHTVLENPKTNLATEIISSDGKTLGKFYFNDNRTPVSYDELPQHLVDALVATEDARYYDHSGVDARGTLRAIFKLGKGGGASTISQQLAKQLFHGEGSKNIVERISQKAKEWIIATKLERQYTKEEIIAQYFNIYDFGNNADGIRSASRIYFGKEPIELDVKESAMLVGMFKNSSLYNPRPERNPVGVKNRRNVVLAQMEKYGYIDEKLKDSLQKLDLGLRYSPESHREGTATYFREYLRAFMKDWTNDEANRKPDGSKYNINSDGLKVYTTIDSRMQLHAEEAVARHMPRLQAEFFHQNTPDRNPTAPFLDLDKNQIDALMKRSMRQSERWRHMKYDLRKSEKEIIASFEKPTKMSVFAWKDGKPSEIDTIMKPLDSMRYYKHFLHPGMMSMDPETGHVKAWVGGMNYRHFQFDHVKQSKRQVGSTFKPFVYATAIDQLHLSPCDELPNTQITIEANKFGNPEPWTPKNSDNKYGGTRTLKNALANSINTITARLMDKVGPQPVVDLVKKLGVESEILAVPSIGLGTSDISVYEMVGAYATFANQGVYTKPVMVTHIEDKNGTILYQFTPESRDVLSEEVAYVTVNLMQGVTQSGSGSRLRGKGRDKWRADYREIITGYPYEFTNPIAGKTGTTQNQSDGWFMGMVPNLVTGVWVGAEDRATHFASITYGQGAAMALPIWGMYMKSCYEDETLNISKGDFKKPENLTIEVNCENYNPNQGGDSENSDEDIPEELDF